MIAISKNLPKNFKSLKWFENRVGKKIYRKAVDCQCSACKDGTENGILVHDKDHAEYLYNVQLDLEIEYSARKI